MANTDNPNGFRLAKTLNPQPTRFSYPVNASQTISKGDAVILSNGLVSIATSSSGALLGIAEHDLTTTASVDRDDVLSVLVGCDNNIFEGQCSGSSTAALVGTSVDIEGTTGIMEVNENATTKQVIRIVGLKSDDDPINNTIGANDRVYFVINRSQFNGYTAAL